ncbi:hypothetical protein Bca4012_003719 [Brassica carinata]
MSSYNKVGLLWEQMACSCFMDMGCSRRNMWDILGSLQPRVSSALYIEMGEFADEPSSLPHVSKRMAVQKGFCLKCFGMISWRVVFGPLKYNNR